MSYVPPPPAGGPPSGPMPPSGGPAGPVAPSDGKAIAAMVCGIVGLVGMCFYGVGIVLSIVALVLGISSRKTIDQSHGQLGGRGMAVTGVVTGIIGIVLFVIGVIALVIWLVALNASY